jgi:hypothetical protein
MVTLVGRSPVVSQEVSWTKQRDPVSIDVKLALNQV